MAIRVLLFSGQPLVGAGLCALLAGHRDLHVLDDTSDDLTLCTVRERLPDVVIIVDHRVLDTEDFTAICKLTAVVWIANEDDPGHALQALAMGARAVLGANPILSELLTAVRMVAVSDLLIAPKSITPYIHQAAPPQAYRFPSALATLTGREREVLLLVSQGMSNEDIARKLFVSVSTVRSHVHHILRKLGVSRRTQAVTVAYAAGMVRHPHLAPTAR